MAARCLVILIVVSNFVLLQSCGWGRTRNYNVDKVSPDGTYRVKVAGTVKDEGDAAGHFTDQGQLQILKREEMIIDRSWNYRDNWDPSFIDCNPVTEWVGNNALRMGGDNSRQTFTDELVISNNSGEHLKYLSIGLGKYESFYVFDVKPGDSVVVRSSPGLNYYAPGEVHIGYLGQMQSGTKLEGELKQQQPENSIRLQITIKPEDVK